VEGTWKKASILKPGQHLVNQDGGMVEIKSIEVTTGEFRLFNITVEDYHTVFTQTLPKGTKLYRFTVKGATDKHYFTLNKDAIPTELGKGNMIRYSDKIIKEEFTLTQDVKVLRSTVNNDGVAGAGQVFSVEVQGKSTVRTIPTVAEDL